MADSGDGSYLAFWDGVGREFPSLAGAPSTRYYRDCEVRLFERHFPDLRGKRVFKTDLWDEAKNTRILTWAAEHGARVFGLDISAPIARDARAALANGGAAPGFVLSDLRAAAFAEGSFDYLYSMGTVEHFDEVEQALRECHRLLRPGGTAIIGVPNRCDPFLRPALVALLYERGLYSYGMEKAFSFRELERLLRRVGFEVIDRTGILFIPGFLRMADLVLHTRAPRLAALTAPFVRGFAALHRRFPSLGRRGYLIAGVARKPGRA